jgi:hypothetical protein
VTGAQVAGELRGVPHEEEKVYMFRKAKLIGAEKRFDLAGDFDRLVIVVNDSLDTIFQHYDMKVHQQANFDIQ